MVQENYSYLRQLFLFINNQETYPKCQKTNDYFFGYSFSQNAVGLNLFTDNCKDIQFREFADVTP